ncbi:MAG: hypothetical protein WBC15_10760 [Mycobacterium sp.]
MHESDTTMQDKIETDTLGICPACGYRRFGVGLCAYCRPVQAMRGPYDFTSTPAAFQPLSPAAAASVVGSESDVADAGARLPTG